jgi:YbbR domain-containing protein
MMHLQDNDDIQNSVPQPPGALERWLRRIFVEDLNTKMLALGITFVLWFAVTGQKKPMTKRISGVQLSFVHAEDMAISNDPPSKVDLTVTGSNDKLERLNAMELLATVLITDHSTGDRVIRLSRDRVKVELPSGVQIEGFQPAIVSVRLEPRVEREVAVHLKFEGTVPDGYEVYGATATPIKVRVRGPASVVNSIPQASTESIVLDGKTSSFDLSQVAVDIPDQKLDVIDGVVTAHVEIAERGIEKSFSNLPIPSAEGNLKQQVGTVTLSAPAWVFAQLRREEIRLQIDPLSDRQSGYRLDLPVTFSGKVKLVAVKVTGSSSVGKQLQNL